MNTTKKLFFSAIALSMVFISCRGQRSSRPPVHLNHNMDQQRRYELQEPNEFFEDNRTLRQPVEGTISRGNLRHDQALYQGINEDSSFVEEIPLDVTRSFLYRGQEQYEIFCTPCHGITGDGQGIIMTGGYGYVPAPSFHQDRLRNVSDGYIYSAIAEGIRNMPSYAHQIQVEDRWAIVAYVRALQRSQYVPEEEMKQFDVDIAALKEKRESQLAEEQAQQAEQESGGGGVSVEAGKQLAQQNACMTCHSTDGSQTTGPTWQNLFGNEVELEDGSTVVADEEYLTESIVNPQANIHAGFPPVMPPYDYLSESEVQSLVEYIKTFSEASSE